MRVFRNSTTGLRESITEMQRRTKKEGGGETCLKHKQWKIFDYLAGS